MDTMGTIMKPFACYRCTVFLFRYLSYLKPLKLFCGILLRDAQGRSGPQIVKHIMCFMLLKID